MDNIDVRMLTKRYVMNIVWTTVMLTERHFILKKCPEKLYKNVCEWIQGDSISDIYISDYSIPMILSIWKSTDFLRALEVMMDLSQSKFEQAEFKIWEMRR